VSIRIDSTDGRSIEASGSLKEFYRGIQANGHLPEVIKFDNAVLFTASIVRVVEVEE
jgi:hypothetical protein